MNTVFDLINDSKRSQLEIVSNVSYTLLWDYLVPYKKEKLPDGITFRVSAGKKNYDVIRLFESGEYFFSQKFIDVLSQFMDMSDKCYPIKVEDAEELEKVTGRTYEKICIIGGGSNNKYLNGLTERITGKKVIVGSPEATALGNILLQEEVYVQ